MAKVETAPLEYVPQTVSALSNPGLLLVSVDPQGRPNVMTIGWGSLGIFWRRPILIAPVRRSRYTCGCIEHTRDFTVNVLPRELADLANFCGSVSGRDHDKFAEAHLTGSAATRVTSPIIEECVLHYECRVVHVNDLVPEAMDQGILDALYAGGDYHRFFFGEIVAVRADDSLKQRL